jgi:hypothetical protein
MKLQSMFGRKNSAAMREHACAAAAGIIVLRADELRAIAGGQTANTSPPPKPAPKEYLKVTMTEVFIT